MQEEQPVQTERTAGAAEGYKESDSGVRGEDGGTQEGASGESIKPIGKGVFGNIYDQFRGKFKEAIAFLKQIKEGEAIAALHHKDIGDISIVWGNKKAGLEKILKKHPEVIDNLQEIIDGMKIVLQSDNRIKLESKTHFAVISKEFQGEQRNNWLLTAYEKRDASDGSMDIDSEPLGKQNGTAPLQDISTDKANKSSSEKQADEPKKEGESAPIVEVGTILKNNEAGGDAVAVVAGSEVKNGERRYLVQFAPDVEAAKGKLFFGDKYFSESDMQAWLNDGRFTKLEDSKPRLEKASGEHAVSEEESILRDALVEQLRAAGIDVVTDNEAAQRVLNEANGKGERVRAQATINGLNKASNFILSVLKGQTKQRKAKIDIPELANRLAEKTLKHPIKSHSISANEIVHIKNRHGENGTANNSNSIPLRDEDISLMPYIMAAPTKVIKGSTAVNGTESVRYEKELENGYVVVVEREGRFDVEDMENITMWAQRKPATDVTVAKKTSHSTSETIVISEADAAKIKKDAEEAIKNDNNVREHRVFHGSGAEFDAFDHSHMGEGEGSQAYGWGTYVTEVEGIGRMYAETPGGNLFKSGFGDFYLQKLQEAVRNGGNFETEKQKLLDWHSGMYDKAKSKSDGYDDFIYDYELLVRLKESDLPSRNLYTVEIPDDTGDNYLPWEKGLKGDTLKRVVDILVKNTESAVKLLLNYTPIDGNSDTVLERYKNNPEGVNIEALKNLLTKVLDGIMIEHVYEDMAKIVGDESMSKMLNESGYVGISYPAEARSGGRNDGARNYVIFNEADAKITDHIRFFRTANGEAYGFTVGGKIYLDPKIATAETPIHEYAHLWADALRKVNPEEWQNVVGLMKGTPVWEEVKKLYPELKSDDEIADEVLAHYSGRRGAERLREEQRMITNGNSSILDKANSIVAIQNVRDALRKFWKGVADWLGIHFSTAEEVADKVMTDLLAGVNPTENAKVNGKPRFQFVGEKGASNMDKAEEATTRLDNLAVAREMEKADKDAKSIKLATGWERGADGKWRYEIMDGEFDRNTYRKHLARLKPKHDVWSWVQEFKEKKEKLGSEASQDDVYYELINEFKEDGYEFGKELMPTKEVFDEAFNLWVRGVDTDGYKTAYNEYQRLAGKFDLGGENNYYNALGGEVEARNVQNRMNMTEEECRNSLASETEDVAREDQIFIMENAGKALDGDITNVEGIEEDEDSDEGMRFREDDLEKANERFNEELKLQIDGSLPEGHIYQLGMPSDILLSTGTPNLPIQMSASRLKAKATSYGHDFDLSEIRDIVKSIQKPIAVFAYGNKAKAQNLIIEIQSNGKNFVVELSLKPIVGGRVLEINSVRNVFPKDTAEWLNWIPQGKALYIDKERIQNLIDQQRTILADVDYLNLDSVTKIVKEFENSSLEDGNLNRRTSDYGYLDSDNNSSVQKLSSEAEKLASSLNTPIRIIRDASEIVDENEARQRRKRNSKGWYDTKIGEIVVVLPNATNIGDIQATVLHEIVGHKGLRGLLGDKLDDMLDGVFKNVPTDVRRKIAREAIDKYKGNVRVATEEYLATVAERGVTEPVIWKRIKSAIREFFRSMGIDLRMTDEDIAYLLWKSKNRLERGDSVQTIIDKVAKDGEIRERLLFRSSSM